MDIQDALMTRRTVHQYTPDPLPEGALDDALRAAIQAPNHKHTIPFRFTVVGPETRAKLAEIAVTCAREKRGGDLSAEGAESARAKVTTPGGLVVFRQVLCEDAAVREEDYATMACAIQNLQLSLHAKGIGSKWGTGGLTRHRDTYALLGVDAQKERIVGFVWAGHPAKIPAPSKPALEDLVTRLP